MITYEYLQEKITELQKCEEKENEFSLATEKFFDCYAGISTWNNGSTIELLSILLQNTENNKTLDETLSYWYYDLECGKNWHKGCMTLGNGEDVKLETLRDVYDYYKKEYWKN